MTQLKHIRHLEDDVVTHGREGYNNAVDTLWAAHGNLTGKNRHHHVSEKVDGSPSIVFGIHPENGKFFVGTKSVWNKTPKVNHTEADIERNHGHAPGLVKTLKHALKHLRKGVTSGVYQGDLMYQKGGERGDVKDNDGHYHFKPNTIQYSVPQNSEHGRKIKRAKVGISVHTSYEGNSIKSLQGSHVPHFSGLKDHPDVHFIGNSITHYDNHNYAEEHATEFKNHMQKAAQAAHHANQSHGHVEQHRTHLQMYINKSSNAGQKPSVDGYKGFLQGRKENTGKLQVHAEKARDHIQRVLDLHHHLQNAKNAIIPALQSSSIFKNTIEGKPTGPEGHVIVNTRKTPPTVHKVVKRTEFSAANRRLNEEVGDHHVVVLKSGCLTSGHEAVVKSAIKGAGGDHSRVHVYVSATHKPGEGSSHPVPGHIKHETVKRSFPDLPASQIHLSKQPVRDVFTNHIEQGHNVTLHGGSDRSGAGGSYSEIAKNHPNVSTVTVGDRSKDNISGTEMRAHIKNGEHEKFHSKLSSGLQQPKNKAFVKKYIRHAKEGMGIEESIINKIRKLLA